MSRRMKLLLCDIEGDVADFMTGIGERVYKLYEKKPYDVLYYIGTTAVKISMFITKRREKRIEEILLWFDTHGRKHKEGETYEAH